MNPSATLRFRRATAVLALGWAVLALIVGVRAQIDAARLPQLPFTFSSAAGQHVIHAVGAEAREAGLRPRDRLISVNGTPVGLWFREAGVGVASDVATRYSVETRDGRLLEVDLMPLPEGSERFLAQRLLGYGILLVGLIYLGIGIGVWRLRGARRESWSLMLFCSVTAAILFLAGPAFPVSALMVLVTIPWIGPTVFQLFTTYPIEPAWILKRPDLRAVPYAGALLLSCAALAEPWMGAMGAWVQPAVSIYTSAFGVLSLGVVGVDRLHNRGSSAADQSNVMFVGGAVSFLPAVVLMGVHAVWGTTFPWTLSLLAFALFPAAVGYGIARNDLFDVRIVAKSSAAYGAVTLAITGLFAFLITFADAVFIRFNVNARSPIFSIIFLFCAILAFNPLREQVQGFVDRFFDRDRLAYRNAMREISEAMVSMLSVSEIVDRILVAVADSMGIAGGIVLLVDEERGNLFRAAARGDWVEDTEELELDTDHPICRALWMRRSVLTRSDFDDEPDAETREACRDVFDGLEAELLVPILFGVDLLGVIAVGRKLSGEALGVDDRQLLRTLANQSAIAIENAQAFDEIAKLNETLEARVEERTKELRETQGQLVQSEKMRSLGQMVAGVAHELSNPIGFVHANLQLLDDFVGRLKQPGLDPDKRTKAREAIRKLLGRAQEGTVQVKQIVEDLRIFSRTDHADLQEVSINEEIDRTLSLMEPRLKGGVEIDRDYAELPRVRCFAGQLNQVFMNLLANACDAMEGRGRISIRTRTNEDGVVLEFEDDGPGIPDDVLSRVFDPFFTTKPVGTGTGLGLSLSHGIIDRHGGTMTVWSEPGQGARFTIALPLEAPPPAEEAEGSLALEAAR